LTAHAAFALVAAVLMSLTPVADADLDQWPTAARAKLEQVVEQAPAGSYAVFDADNTVWKNDLEEALLPFLENRGELSPAALDAALRPVPLLPGETLYGYYQRLCAIDDKVCYPWSAQVFAGRSLGDLKRDVDALMAAAGTPIPVSYSEGTVTLSGLRLGGAGVLRYLSRLTTPRDPLYAGFATPPSSSAMRPGCIPGFR